MPVTEPSSSSAHGGRSHNGRGGSPVLVWLGLCCLASGLLNIFHAHYHHYQQQQHFQAAMPMTRFAQKRSVFHRGGRHNAVAPGTSGALQMAMHNFLHNGVGRRGHGEANVVDNNHPQEAQPDTDKEIDQTEHNHIIRQPPPVVAADSPPHDPHSQSSSTNQLPDTLATLSCAAHGGPDNDRDAQEMVYWHDIPSDARYLSPFATLATSNPIASDPHAPPAERYLTFEPDGGGWNNIRMAMETVIGLAIATGRTLVLPAQQRMYLLGKRNGQQRTEFDFDHFFPIYEMAAEHDALKVISMEDFLHRVAMTGQLRNKVTGQVEFPPGNRTDWNGQNGPRMDALKDYLRNTTHTPKWLPGDCLAAFPNDTSTAAVDRLQAYKQQAARSPLQDAVIPHPLPPAQASPVDRLRQHLSRRRKLCVYDTEAQAQPVLHFICSHKLGYRMLVHFYAFLFFEDYRDDLWMKRFMRDHIRYKDPIQCAAARIVAALRQEFGDFDTFHIRRGDFQFKKTRIEATQIYKNVQDVLPEGRALFLATDERNKTFFDPLRQHYQIRFLDDYMHLLEGVNTNFYGMIDQLVASRGTRFFGCWHSTFSGFINRMRGYHSANHQLAGYQEGRLPNSYYYVPRDKRNAMHTYTAISGAFFNREFPTSWHDLDASVGDLPSRQAEPPVVAAAER